MKRSILLLENITGLTKESTEVTDLQTGVTVPSTADSFPKLHGMQSKEHIFLFFPLNTLTGKY